MKWPTVPLKEIAPAQTPNIRFSPDEPVWHLTLDQVESHTGNIVNKKIAPTSAAGTSTNVFDDGNVLYSKLRPYLNKVICPTEPGIATTELVPLRPRKDLLDRRYLTYYLRSNHFLGFANVAVAGVKMPRIIMTKFWKHRIPLPPLSEQHRIVEILDQADALRKRRAEADAKAARILPALFYKMFGDPATNPRRWSVKKLGDPQVTTVNPKFSSAGVSDNTQFSFLPMADVDEVWGRIIGKQVRSYSDVARGFTSFQDNDVLFAKITPCMQNGKAAIARNLVNGRGFGSTEFHVLRASALSTPEWLYVLMRLPWFRKQAESSFTGTVGQQRVPTDFLANYTIGCPPIELQQKFAKAVLCFQEWVDQTDRSRRCLENIFSVLLHRAFTGDLTAKWRVAHMRELLAEMEAQAKALDCPSTQSNSPEVGSKRHAGHDMFNKAALAAYITDRCHAPDRPMGRVKLAKLFYLVQQKAEIELTETFMKRAAGPLDDEIHKFLSLAQKSKWLVLCRGEGDLKPVRPGANVSKAIEQAQKLLGPSKAKVDEMLDQMKGWGYRALERWATVLDASFELTAAGQPATVEGVKDIIQRHPDWVPKLSRDEFSDTNIEAALKGLRGFGFKTNQD
jgi:type I restriction enzyme S subunit